MHDLAAARAHVLGARSAAAAGGLPALADAGYEGAGHEVWTPVKQPADGRPLDLDTRTYHAVLRSLRCRGERGFALRTGRWRVRHHVTACPHTIGDIAQAARARDYSRPGSACRSSVIAVGV